MSKTDVKVVLVLRKNFDEKGKFIYSCCQVDIELYDEYMGRHTYMTTPYYVQGEYDTITLEKVDCEIMYHFHGSKTYQTVATGFVSEVVYKTEYWKDGNPTYDKHKIEVAEKVVIHFDGVEFTQIE